MVVYQALSTPDGASLYTLMARMFAQTRRKNAQSTLVKLVGLIDLERR